MAYKYRRRNLNLSRLKTSIKSDRRVIKFIAFALIFLAAGAGIYIFIETYLLGGNLDLLYMLALPELLTRDYTQVSVDADVSNGVGVVALTAGCKQIIANTEVEQAESIARGLAGYVDVRPDTHDMMRDAFENFGIKVNMLKITEIRNSTFIGRLILQKGEKIASLDVRPSDGTAIAVRVGAPIYVNNKLLEEYGKDIC